MKNHYLIVRSAEDESKMKLVQCVKAGDNKLKVRLTQDGNESFIIKKKEIVADLGATPVTGKVYGIQVEPLIDTRSSDFWGDIRIYRWMTEEESDCLHAGLKRVKDEVKRRKLPKPTVDLEIRMPKGKMAGYYKHLRGAEKDILALLALDDNKKMMDYLISHEYAHGLWFRNMSPKARMRWVKHYHQGIKVEKVGKADLKSLLDNINGDGSFASFLKSDCEDKMTVLAVLRNIKIVHSLNKQHLELLLSTGEGIDEYWPTSIEVTEKDVLLTEYARKSPEELFAEAFSYHFTGNKIPKVTTELLDKTLRNLIK